MCAYRSLSCYAETKDFTRLTSGRLDGQKQSFLFFWDSNWLPYDKGVLGFMASKLNIQRWAGLNWFSLASLL